MAILGGGAAQEVAAEVGERGLGGAEGADVGAGAVGEAGDLAEGAPLRPDRVEALAAVEHGLVVPPPGALPPPPRVDAERVEDDGERGEAAEGRLRLRLEDGDEAEEPLHGAPLERLREQPPPLRRRELHRRRRRQGAPVQRRHRRRRLVAFRSAAWFRRHCGKSFRLVDSEYSTSSKGNVHRIPSAGGNRLDRVGPKNQKPNGSQLRSRRSPSWIVLIKTKRKVKSMLL